MEFTYRGSRIDEELVEDAADELAPYAERLLDVVAAGDLDAEEASLCLLDDDEGIEAVRAVWNSKRTDELAHIFLIGIGGSNLGFKAFYDASRLFRDEYEDLKPRFHFLDEVSVGALERALALIAKLRTPKEILVIAASKSGGTTETAFNFEVVHEALAKRFGRDAATRIVCVTDEGSALEAAADEHGFTPLAIPEMAGGRYSVFSAAGLLPLFAAGFDVREILDRAKSMRDSCLSGDVAENPALVSAAAVHAHYEDGRTMHNLFVFGAELESLGKWHRQLMAESLGKREDLDGETVHAGITPIVSVGSADLHSTGQLYLEGPDDKITTFVSMERERGPKAGTPAFDLVPDLQGRSAGEIGDAILSGVVEAYYDAGLPFMEARLDSVADIGAFMQWKMIETMYLGALLNINAFDQPGVEAYKENVRNILSS